MATLSYPETFLLLQASSAYLDKLRRHARSLPELPLALLESVSNIAAANKIATALLKIQGQEALAELSSALGLQRAANEKVQFSKTDLEEMLLSAWYSYRNAPVFEPMPGHYAEDLDPECTLPEAVIMFFEDAFAHHGADSAGAAALEKAKQGVRDYVGHVRGEGPAIERNALQIAFHTASQLVRKRTLRGVLVGSAQIRVAVLRRKAAQAYKTLKPMALAYYSQALLIAESPVLLLCRAALLQELDAHEDAIEDLKKATKANPAFSVAHARLAFLYLSIGNATELVRSYVKALEALEGLILPPGIDEHNKYRVDRYVADVRKKTVSDYVAHVVRALRLAEARARQQGVSSESLKSMTQSVRRVILRHTPRPQVNIGNIGSTQPGQQVSAQPGAFGGMEGLLGQGVFFGRPTTRTTTTTTTEEVVNRSGGENTDPNSPAPQNAPAQGGQGTPDGHNARSGQSGQSGQNGQNMQNDHPDPGDDDIDGVTPRPEFTMSITASTLPLGGVSGTVSDLGNSTRGTGGPNGGQNIQGSVQGGAPGGTQGNVQGGVQGGGAQGGAGGASPLNALFSQTILNFMGENGGAQLMEFLNQAGNVIGGMNRGVAFGNASAGAGNSSGGEARQTGRETGERSDSNDHTENNEDHPMPDATPEFDLD